MQSNMNETNHPQTECLLYAPKKEDLTFYTNNLGYYTADTLKKWAKVLYKFFSDKKVKVEGANRLQVVSYIEEYNKKHNNPYKTNILHYLAIFWADPRNFTLYLDTLPSGIQKVWRQVVANWYIEAQEAKKISGTVFATQTQSWWRRDYQPQPVADLFLGSNQTTYTSNDRISSYYFYLPEELRRQLLPWALGFDPENPPIFKGELPEDLILFNCEKKLFTEFSLLNGLAKQKKIELNEKGKLTASQIKAAAKIIACQEFYDTQTAYHNTGNLRAQMLVTAYAIFMHVNPQSLPEPKAIKELFNNTIPQYFTYLFTLFFPHLSGLKMSEYKSVYFGNTKIGKLIDYVCQLSTADHWIKAHELLEYLQHKEGPINYWNIWSRSTLTNKWDAEVVTWDYYYKEEVKSLYLGFLFLMGAYGLLELAYTPIKESASTPFENLQYIRLTPLGAYVFRMQDSYEPVTESQADKPFFELDEKILVARALQDNNPYEAFLANLSTPIGQRRYRVSQLSVLNNCKDEKDVENSISFFKQFICKEPPLIWQDFFRSLTDRTNALKPVSMEKYILYQIDSQKQELIRLIASDPEIRKYTYRAENYLLLVERSKLNKFISLLKKHGYIFDPY